MDRRARRLARARDHSYGIVLLLVLASAAFEVAAPDTALASLITVLLAAATLLTSVWAAHARHRVVRLATGIVLAVAVFAAVTLVARGSIPNGATAIAGGLVVALAPGVIATGVLRELRAERAVTVRTLSGVLAIYLLAGMFFSFLFGAVHEIDGPFFAQVADPSRSDVTEGLLGQIYLVTVVALIVSNLARFDAHHPGAAPR